MKIGKEAEVLVNEETAAAEEQTSEVKEKRKFGQGMELQDWLRVVMIIAAVISFIFVLLSQAALNGKGFYQFQAFGMKKPVDFEFLTTALAGWIAGGFAVVSLGSGIGINIIRKKNGSTINIIPGVAMLVLSVICLLADHFAS